MFKVGDKVIGTGSGNLYEILSLGDNYARAKVLKVGKRGCSQVGDIGHPRLNQLKKNKEKHHPLTKIFQ